MSFSKRALASTGPRRHVQIEVEKVWPDIVEARDAGASLSAIFRELKADGKNVGAGYSSFRSAVRYFDKNPPVVTGATPFEQGTEGQVNTPSAKPSRDRFSDQRHQSDWG